MAGSIAKAYVQVIPSAQGIRGKLSSMLGGEASAAGDSAGSSFASGLISKAKGLIAAAGIGKTLGASLTAGGALQQSLGGVETLFKDSAAAVIANAEKAYQTAGMSANQYMETVTGFSASLLQSLGGDTAAAAAYADRALVDMADNVNKFGSSAETVQNAYQGFAKQNYTMLDNLKLGYGGTKEEMQRLIKDAAKLTDVQKEMGVTVDANSMSFGNVVNAISVMQKQMGIAGATYEESAKTFSGSMASMKAAFSDVLANLSTGRDIGPSLNALGGTVKTFLVNNLLPMVGNIMRQLPMVIGSAISIGEGIFAELPEMLSMALSTAVRSINSLTKNAGTILQVGTDLVLGIGEAVITNAPYFAEAAFKLVAAFGEVIITTDWMQIATDTITGLRDGLDIAAGEIFGTDGNLLQTVMDAMSAGLPGFLDTGVGIVSNIVGGITSMVPGLLETGTGVLQSFTGQIFANFPMVMEAGGEIITVMMGGISSLFPVVLDTALELLTSFLDNVITNLPMALQTGTEVTNTLVNGVLSMLPQVVSSALTAITTFANQLIASLPMVLSSGQTILLNLVEGIRTTLPQILASAGEAVGTLLTGIIQNLPSIISAGFDLVISLITGLGNAAPDLFDGAADLIGNVWKAVKSINWAQVGRDIVQGLINGIGAMGNALWNAARSVANSALSSIKRALGIRSPSKVMRDQVGKWIPSGVAVGIEANTKPLKNAMHDVAAMTTDTLQTDLQMANTIRGWPAASVGGTPGSAGHATAMEMLLELVGDIEEGNTALLNANNSLLQELLEAVLGIRITDDMIGRATDRYNRRMAIIRGGQ